MRHRSGLAAAAALLCTLAPLAPAAVAEEVTCTVTGGTISVDNFPSLQSVAIERVASPIEVKDVGLSQTYSTVVDLGTGERRPLGPFSVLGKKRATVQVTLLEPRTRVPQPPLALRWLVRFDREDAFFDPCPKDPAEPCRTGFSGGGLKMKLLPPGSLADRVEDFYIYATESPTIGTLDLLGEQGLLLLDNTGASARTVRVHVIVDR